MKTYGLLVVANLKEMLRDRMALFWFLAFPILFVLLFGTIFGGDTSSATYTIGLVVEDEGDAGRGLQQVFNEISAFRVHSGTRDEEVQALRGGHRSLVVVLPAGMSQQVSSGGKVEVPVYYDASRQLNNQVLLPAVIQVLTEFERQATGRPRLFEPRPEAVQSAQLKAIDYLLPSILAMGLMQLGLFGSLRLVSLREKKILKQLGATPLARSLLLLGEVTVRLLMAVVQMLTIILVGKMVFGINIVGNWFAVLGIVILGAATFVSLGYMLVSFVRSEESGQGIIQLVQFPMMFLSGVFFSVDMMPGFLQPVVRAMPLTYLADALRQIMTGSPPLYAISTDLLVLAAWLLITTILGARFFQWE